MSGLSEKIQPRIHRILHDLAALEQGGEVAAPEDWAVDLERMRAAAEAVLTPLGQQPAVEPVPARAEVPQPAAARILVVDDDAANRNLLQRRLERQGYRVEVAATGSEALDRLATEPFDLALLDLAMPGMDGFEVLARLKADRHMRFVPVVVAAAPEELDSAVRALQSGAEDYLLKPFDPVLLRTRIGGLLALHRKLGDDVQRALAALEEHRTRLNGLAGNIGPEILAGLQDSAALVEENIARLRKDWRRGGSRPALAAGGS
jgi:CheY-like chemotaxis protein